MSLSRKMRFDAKHTFTNPHHHGEWAVLYPKDEADGSVKPRRVPVVVDRDQDSALEASLGGDRPIPDLIVEIANSDLAGMTHREFDKGEMEIDIALEPGGDLERRTIIAVYSRDVGMMRLGVA